MSSQPPTPSPVVLASRPAPSSSQRLAQQLQTLSQVVETLSYRLLELEERLATHDRSLQEFAGQERADSVISATAQGRLDDTEERLQRIEALLAGDAACSPSPAGEAGVPDIDGPFPEEPEQAFLDEPEGGGAEAASWHGRESRGFLTA